MKKTKQKRHSLSPSLSPSPCLISAALTNWEGEGLSVPALRFGSAFRIYWPVLHPLTEFYKHQSSCFGRNPGIKKLFGKVFLTKNLSVWSTFQYFVWSRLKPLISPILLALCVCCPLDPVTPLYGDICFTFLPACLRDNQRLAGTAGSLIDRKAVNATVTEVSSTHMRVFFSVHSVFWPVWPFICKQTDF